MIKISTDDFLNTTVPSDPLLSHHPTLLQSAAQIVQHHPRLIRSAGAVAKSIVDLSVSLWNRFGANNEAARFTIDDHQKMSGMASFGLEFKLPPHHDMHRHQFSESSCPGARLYYHLHTPILEISTQEPFAKGFAKGYLPASGIYALRARFDFANKLQNVLPDAEKSKHVIEELKKVIPEELLTEISGMVAGYNQWIEENGLDTPPLTFDEALLFHLLPDTFHFEFPSDDHEANSSSSDAKALKPGCTVIIDRNELGELVAIRNLDWDSLGAFGQYSFILLDINESGLSSLELSVPGMVGTLTGMNTDPTLSDDQGITLSMNVCPGTTRHIRGLPACFFNKYCLSHFNTVDQVEEFIQDRNTLSPLGPYHLTLTDAKRAVSFQLVPPNSTRASLKREYQEESPLIVTNQSYSKREEQYLDQQNNQERKDVLAHFFRKAKETIAPDLMEKGRLLTFSRSLPFVNSQRTIHSVKMIAKRKVFSFAVDNSHAGSAPLTDLSFRELLTRNRANLTAAAGKRKAPDAKEDRKRRTLET